VKRAPFSGRRRERGFGLVELMVALVLGLLVVGAASVMFIGTRQTGRTTDSLSRMQDSMRVGFDLMIREVREAGGTPCDSQVAITDVLSNAQGGAPTWWAVWSDPVRGYGGTDAFAGATIGGAVGERVSGTDAILVRYAPALDELMVNSHDTAAARFTLNVNAHGLLAGDLVMVCNYAQGAIAQVSSANPADGTFMHDIGGAAPGNCSKGLGRAEPALCTATGTTFQFSAGSRVGRFNAVGWYIGNNGRAASGGRSLYRVTRSGAEEVADGVRAMQLSYLLSTGTAYVAAAAVPAANWGTVIAVRVDLTYESSDSNVATNASTPRLTRPVSFTANLRNLQP